MRCRVHIIDSSILDYFVRHNKHGARGLLGLGVTRIAKPCNFQTLSATKLKSLE